ncbi:hypothetical protein Cgig2_028223 [Carnegiea gigantea]|uniref:Glycosyltransferase n=1 Tax=Carnegiea gigantea TaxID=171969 RepID=A0A9Q1JNZ3_9CARY|nr:hypothetical protein Cgig2_028223 [Carnegiea gigantea]
MPNQQATLTVVTDRGRLNKVHRLNFNLIECDKPGLQNYHPNFGGNHHLLIAVELPNTISEPPKSENHAHGHLIPMVDMGRLLAQQGVTVTIFTTPLNANRFSSTINRDAESGLRIRAFTAQLPTHEVGLTDGCESMDMLPSRDLFTNLLHAMNMMQHPLEEFAVKANPRVSCIIADKNHSWIVDTSSKFKVPWVAFDGTSCYSLLCKSKIISSKVLDNVVLDSEPFEVPGMPGPLILTKSQLPDVLVTPNRRNIIEAEGLAYGVVINSFEELEGEYLRELRKVKGEKVWCVGPVSLCNKDNMDMVERGEKSSVEETECLNWLDEQQPGSVVYACLGSQSRPTVAQLIELGLGLEGSNWSFIWVIRGKNSKLEGLQRWLSEEKFESRIKGRGLLIRGWAPQLLILSHHAVGGFLTHCGWNSTLEAICAGTPMITWPLFAEQFFNEKFIVQVLKIGVRIGAEFAVKWGEEEKFGVVIRREDVMKAVNDLMNENGEGQDRRQRAEELGKMANMAVGGGSSFLNVKSFINDIKETQCLTYDSLSNSYRETL